jgi:hypothetical protein
MQTPLKSPAYGSLFNESVMHGDHRQWERGRGMPAVRPIRPVRRRVAAGRGAALGGSCPLSPAAAGADAPAWRDPRVFHRHPVATPLVASRFIDEAISVPRHGG